MVVSTAVPSSGSPAPAPDLLGIRIMRLPPELRLQIFAELCSPKHHLQWLPRKNRYPPEIMNEGVHTYYRSKRLIIEISRLTPHTSKQSPYPSILRMYDTDRDLDLNITSSAPLICPQTFQNHKPLKLSELDSCPFYMFPRITIRIPPCENLLSLVAIWARLNVVGYILGKLETSRDHAKTKGIGVGIDLPDRLPQVDVVFEDCASWSWTDDNGKPKLCPANSDELRMAGDSRPPSILVILLRALYRLRDSAHVKVRVPDNFPHSELKRKFSLTWMMDEQANGTQREEPEFREWLRSCDSVLPKMFFTTSPGSTLPEGMQRAYLMYLTFQHHGIKSDPGTLYEQQNLLERALQRIAEALHREARRKSKSD